MSTVDLTTVTDVELAQEFRRRATEIRMTAEAKPTGVIYLLWSGKHGAWWKPNANGYTVIQSDAGRYDEATATRYVVQSAQCGILEQVTRMVAAPVGEGVGAERYTFCDLDDESWVPYLVRVRGWEGWRFEVSRYGGIPGSVKVTSPAGVELTASLFRKVPIGRVLRLATDPWPNVALVAEYVGTETRPKGGSREHSAAVATVYRFAISQGAHPREAIKRLFGEVSFKTVDRWIKECRERGLLGTWEEERQQQEIKPPGRVAQTE